MSAHRKAGGLHQSDADFRLFLFEGTMRKQFNRYLVIAIQVAALFAMQFNMVAPQVANLFSPDVAEESAECHCSPENCRNGTCCCNHAKEMQPKVQCPSEHGNSGPASLGACPCSDPTHLTLVSPADSSFIGFFVEPHSCSRFPGPELVMREAQRPSDHIADPPDPPPRLFLTV
jgi:hypothetical protein